MRITRPPDSWGIGILTVLGAIGGAGFLIAFPENRALGIGLLVVALAMLVGLILWYVAARFTEWRAARPARPVRPKPPSKEAHAGVAEGRGVAFDASVRMTDSISHLVIPGPGNPTLPQVGYQTAGRRHYAYGALKRRPRAIRFSKPEDRLLRPADLPFEMPCGGGQIVVEKFYSDGVVIDEVGTVGDPVAFVAYFDD